jgi:two-component sensor histidine kinase
VGDNELALRGSEQNGPRVSAPASRGVGSGAVERMLRSQLKGDIRYDWRPEGLICEIRLPFVEVKPLRAHAPS